MHRVPFNKLARALVLLTLSTVMLASCGTGSAKTSKISFRSPAVNADGVIRASTRCGGGSLWLPLEWSSVPSGAKELAVYIGRFKYERVHGTRELTVPFADLVSNIDPAVHRIEANKFPQDVSWSTIGTNSCPAGKRKRNVLQELFVLDRVRPNRELDHPLAMRLTREALGDEPHSGSRSPGALTEDAMVVGRFTAIYEP